MVINCISGTLLVILMVTLPNILHVKGFCILLLAKRKGSDTFDC